MDSQQLFTGRSQHRHEGQVHFAEVTVKAEPCPGDSEVFLSSGVLETLQKVFGADFAHHRHCVHAAVAVTLLPLKRSESHIPEGLSAFHAEVVDIRVSGNAGREVSGALLSIAGMNAMCDCLEAWHKERTTPAGPVDGHQLQESDFDEEIDVSIDERDIKTEFSGKDFTEPFTLDLELKAIYQTCFVMAFAEFNSGSHENEIRKSLDPYLQNLDESRRAVAVEGIDDALAGRPQK